MSAAPAAVRNVSRDSVLAEHLEIAASLWGRFLGLMGRQSLPKGHGLFIDGTNGIHMFFMRFPIDVVFVSKPDPEGLRRVLSVHRRVRPWVGMVPIVRGAAGVLELPVGTIAATRTERGDSVRLD